MCRRLVGLVERWRRGHGLVLLTFDDPEAGEDLARLPRDRRYSAFHLVAPFGEIRSGEGAVLPVLGLLVGGKTAVRLVHAVPGAEAGIRRAYRWVAANRQTLGRLLEVGRGSGGTRSCDTKGDRPAPPPGRVGQRAK